MGLTKTSMFTLFPVGKKEDLEKLESSFLDGTFKPFPDHVKKRNWLIATEEEKESYTCELYLLN